MLIELYTLLLTLPLNWELIDDHKGDAKHKFDVYIRWILAAIAATAVWYLTAHSWGSSFALSLSLHFLLFDYLIVIILRRYGVIAPSSRWFTYLGKSSDIDKDKMWNRIGPWGRLIARIVPFAISLYFFLR